MKLYKVLDKDLTSPFQDFQFEIGKEYVCNDFDEDPNNICSNGFYATDIEGLLYSFNIKRQVFECAVSGKSVEIDMYKRRYEKFKLIKKISHSTVKKLALAKEKECGYKLNEVLFPINPLLIKTKQVTQNEIELLKNWASVGASVRASVWDSVGDSVRDSVRDSVWASVRDSVWASVWASVRDSVGASVRDSVRASVRAYISSLFPNIKKWRYVRHKEGINPFQSGIDLWYNGFVPSFDGKIWRLHTGKKAKIVYEWEK